MRSSLRVESFDLLPSSKYILVRVIPSCLHFVKMCLWQVKVQPEILDIFLGELNVVYMDQGGGACFFSKHPHEHIWRYMCLHMCKHPYEHILGQARKKKRKKIYKNSLILKSYCIHLSEKSLCIYIICLSMFLLIVRVVSHKCCFFICLYWQMFTLYSIFSLINFLLPEDSPHETFPDFTYIWCPQIYITSVWRMKTPVVGCYMTLYYWMVKWRVVGWKEMGGNLLYSTIHLFTCAD
jgi:hypothetical protein